MATSISVPSRIYDAGSRSVRLDKLPQTMRGARIRLTRESWPASPPIVGEIVVRASSDDGVTWVTAARATLPGGVVLGKDGQPLVESVLAWEWPRVAGPDGQPVPVRITDVEIDAVTYVRLRTAITAEAF